MNLKERNFSELSLIFSFLLFVFFIPVSVSFTHIFLALSILSFIYYSLSNKTKIKIPRTFIVLLIFILFEIISTIFSIDFKRSMDDLKEILLFLIVPLTFNLTPKKEDFKVFNYALSLAIFLSAILSFLEYSGIIMERERASGFLSHYMTQSGILMLFSILSLSMTFYEKGKKKFLWLFLFFLSIFSLILTLTRSAWIGVIIGLLLIIILYRPKLMVPFLILSILIAFISPESIKKRFMSTFDPKDETVKERIYMAKAGLKIISKYPIFGTGLDTAKIAYKKFKPPEAVRDVPHLHSNIFQIGAELGIPALSVWLLFIIFSFLDNYKVWKFSSKNFTKFSGLAGVGVIISFFIAGLFEFNFGDSEVKMLFLYLITYPLSLWEIERNEHKKT
jgi:O-antigen ligase